MIDLTLKHKYYENQVGKSMLLLLLVLGIRVSKFVCERELVMLSFIYY